MYCYYYKGSKPITSISKTTNTSLELSKPNDKDINAKNQIATSHQGEYVIILKFNVPLINVLFIGLCHGSQKYECTVCGKQYSHKSSLSRHKNEEHKETVGKVLCSIYDLGTCSVHNCNAHVNAA